MASPKEIQLINPNRQHFESFIFANALKCERVVQEDTNKGQTVVICGAGPTLRDHAAKWCPRGDQVWGCNSAATWLYQHGYKVTHGFTIDQQPQMVAEWYDAPPLDYLLATSVHPHLTEHLRKVGRHVTFFHNFVGLNRPNVEYCACGHIKHPKPAPDTPDPGCEVSDCDCMTYRPMLMSYENWLYSGLFEGTIVASSGLNSVTRAIDLALYMGFEKIIVLGADCCLRVKSPPPNGLKQTDPGWVHWLETQTEMHADGGSALASGATAMTLYATIDGRFWLTKADLIITAVWLVRWKRKLGKRLTLIGDTLVKALRDKPEDYLQRLPTMVDAEGKPIEVEVGAEPIRGFEAALTPEGAT